MSDDHEEEDIEFLRELVKSYRALVPNLIEQTGAARREAAGVAPKPRPCDSVSRSGETCELPAGHTRPHKRHGDTVVWSWGP